MRSQHKQNRRPRGNKLQEDEQYGPTRMDESSDSYSRSHRASHRSDRRRESSTSSREYYDGYRELDPHPRNRHDEEAWYTDVSRYREEDVYRRESDYDPGMRRDSDWGARSSTDSQYPNVRDDWPPQAYNHPSSYHDSSSWTAAASHDAYEGGSYYRDWSISSGGPRGSSSRVREDDRNLRHGDKQDHEDAGWSGGTRGRDKGSHHSRYQNDSGWDTRRRDNGWEDIAGGDPQSLEDRQWEPAPSWKSTHRNEGTSQNRNQNQNNGQRNPQQQQKQQQNSKGKRNYNSKQQRRDWKNDDSNLNNWTRRDYNQQSRKSSKNQQQQQSSNQRSKQYHSRSRSRSPAESYQSRLSSRGQSRSRSRSPAPKRRRRDSDHIPQSRTPSDRDAPGWLPRQGGSIYSKSPSPQHNAKLRRSRGQSISSVSSATSGRTSRSNSPNSKTRPVHRLPTSGAAAPMDLDGGRRNSQHGNSHQFSKRSNGKQRVHDRHDRTTNLDRLSHSAIPEPQYDDAMPPPSTIPPPRSSYPPPELVTPETPLTRVNIASKPNRKSSFGFKPISRAQPTPSSSLRKFFPGDDDDPERTPPVEQVLPNTLIAEPQSGHKASASTVPPGKGVWPPPGEQLEDTQLQPPWSATESTVPPHVEPIYHGQHQVKLPPQPKPVETSWNGAIPTPQPLLPASSLTDELRNPPPQKAQTPVVSPLLPRPASSGRLPFTEETPPPVSVIAHPPPSSSVVSASAVDESHSSNSIPPLGKPVYNILAQVGEGTFGKVYKARNSISGLLVALKRIRMEAEKDGFPVTAMREIKLLQSLRHENVVQLYEMIVSHGSVYMVFEYNHHDLTGILSQTQFEFTDAHLKSLCHQMLAGLAYLHHKGVIHRDIKGSNILINNRGELKLADFGLARFYQKRRRTDYTNRVITLWYRPPELLFGATVYGPEVDMWSAGCIMLELFTRKPIFQGNDEIHQLEVIHKILGTPTPDRWPGLVDLPWYELARPRDEIPDRFRDIFQRWMSPAALDLAEQLLAYDPLRRLSAHQAMETPYFTQEAPPAQLPTGLSTLEGEWHELETKRERAKKRKKNEDSA